MSRTSHPSNEKKELNNVRSFETKKHISFATPFYFATKVLCSYELLEIGNGIVGVAFYTNLSPNAVITNDLKRPKATESDRGMQCHAMSNGKSIATIALSRKLTGQPKKTTAKKLDMGKFACIKMNYPK